jgi:hypothetical protein
MTRMKEEYGWKEEGGEPTDDRAGPRMTEEETTDYTDEERKGESPRMTKQDHG